jgi:hypothetical protein
MRGLRLRALFVGLAALPACSLFVDLDGLSSDGEVSTEAGADASSPIDATRETAVNEASIDAGPSNDPCTTTHALCENFDEDSGMFGSMWSTQNDQARIDITSDASVSPPASLRITPKKSGDFAAIFATITQSPLPKGVKCGFAMQVDNYPTGSTAEYLDIQVTSGDPSVDSYNLEAYGATQDVGSIDDNLDLVDGGGHYNSKNVPLPVFDGEWHELTVVITLSGSPTLELDVDGTLGAIQPIAPPGSLAAVVFSVGFDADDSVGAVWTARFDNLVCDWIN